MSKFEIIPCMSCRAELASTFVKPEHSYCMASIVDERGQLVSSTYQGKKYEIVDERVRYFSTLERVGRCFLGILLGVGAIFSKSVRDLFTKDHVKIRYGRLVHLPHRSKGPITIDMVKQINIWTSENKVVNGDIIFNDGKCMTTQSFFKKAEVQALIREFPDKIKILDYTDFTEKPDDPQLKGVKVLKYLFVFKGSGVPFEPSWGKAAQNGKKST